MKILRLVCTVLFTALAFTASAKSGPEIPKPIVNMEQAIAAAKNEMVHGNVLIAESQEYILLKIEYVKIDNRWHWEVTFVHPVFNDHTLLYAVEMDRSTKLLEATE